MARRSSRGGRRSAGRKRSSKWLRIGPGRWVLLATAAALLGVQVALHFGGQVWLLDAANHFRTWITAPSIAVLALTWLLADRRGWMIAGIAASMILLLVAAPGFGSLLRKSSPSDGASLRVVTFNLYGRNERIGEAVRWLYSADADVIALQEAGEGWRRRVEFSSLGSMDRPEGPPGASVELLTRPPMRTPQVLGASPHRSVAVGVIEFDGGPVCVASIHPNTAIEEATWRARNEDLRLAAYWIATGCPADAEKIVLGDWNTAPWSLHFRRFLRVNDLVWANASVWPQPTRLFAPPLEWLGAPIDQVATTRGLRAVSCKRGPAAGSDHRPVLCEIVRVRS